MMICRIAGGLRMRHLDESQPRRALSSRYRRSAEILAAYGALGLIAIIIFGTLLKGF